MPKLLLFLLCAPLAAQLQSPADLAGATAGERAFHHHCAGCHGRNAQGGRGPDLTRGGHSDDELALTIRDGVSGTDMEAYGDRLAGDDIRGIVSYLRAASRDDALLKGDAGRGETLYWSKGQCGNCHAIGVRGTRIGPDLSRVASRRSIPYLRESLTAPGAAITPEFDFLTVVTREGKTIRGVQRAADDFSVVLIDTAGAIQSLDRATLRSVTPDAAAHSFTTALAPAGLDDILAYLWTLRAPASARAAK